MPQGRDHHEIRQNPQDTLYPRREIRKPNTTLARSANGEQSTNAGVCDVRAVFLIGKGEFVLFLPVLRVSMDSLV